MRISDWSSDVCSSDLSAAGRTRCEGLAPAQRGRRAALRLSCRGRGWRRGGAGEDRKNVVAGKCVSVRVDLGGRRSIKEITLYSYDTLRTIKDKYIISRQIPMKYVTLFSINIYP